MNRRIYNVEDYYEHNLIPQLLNYPHKFVHRLKYYMQQKQSLQLKNESISAAANA
jgi:hypothetical protein